MYGVHNWLSHSGWRGFVGVGLRRHCSASPKANQHNNSSNKQENPYGWCTKDRMAPPLKTTSAKLQQHQRDKGTLKLGLLTIRIARGIRMKIKREARPRIWHRNAWAHCNATPKTGTHELSLWDRKPKPWQHAIIKHRYKTSNRETNEGPPTSHQGPPKAQQGIPGPCWIAPTAAPT